MTIIDFHTHLGQGQGKHLDDLLRSMDEAKIDKSVIFASTVLKFSNEELLKVLELHPDRFYGMIYVNPKELLPNSIFDHELVLGGKFYTGYEHYFPNDPSTEFYLNLLETKKKLAVFHSGDCYCAAKTAKLKYAHPLHIDDIAVDYPNLKIVIAHMGYPWHRDTAEVMYKNKNVYTDVSGFVYGKFSYEDKTNYSLMLEEFERIHGSFQRVLFGTDWPISDQSSYIETLNEKGLLHELNSNNQLLLKDLGK